MAKAADHRGPTTKKPDVGRMRQRKLLVLQCLFAMTASMVRQLRRDAREQDIAT
jgi:hypothetical protein